MVKRKIWMILGMLVIFFLTAKINTLALNCSSMDSNFRCEGVNLEQWCQDNTSNALSKSWVWTVIKTCGDNEVCDKTIRGCRAVNNNDCTTSTGAVRKSNEMACGEDIYYLYTCNNGSWNKGTKCESNVINTFVCQNDDSSNTASCVRSTSTSSCNGYKCEGKQIYEWCGSARDLYTWIERKTCTDSEYCDKDSGTCKANTESSQSCTSSTYGTIIRSGGTTCGENVYKIYTCNNGIFDQGKLCAGGMFCKYNSSGTASCVVSKEVKDASEKSIKEYSIKNYDPTCTTDGGLGINTALGCLPTTIGKFVPWLLKYLFGIAGGIAFLLMVYGFILIATSGGEEKKMAGAKETITSAIIGLLVCIFSIFILRLITVNILQIPGI